MSNRHRPPGQGQGKPQEPAGISADLGQLRSRVDQVEKTVREHFAEKNQWSAEVRSWVGKKIHILLAVGTTVFGELRWVDRYTMCLFGKPNEEGDSRNIIVHKGAIVMMYLDEEGSTTAAA